MTCLKDTLALPQNLLKEKRAIVTDVPGTTRDVIEEYLNLDGIPIRITDTAGIRETEDIVEKIDEIRLKHRIDGRFGREWVKEYFDCRKVWCEIEKLYK